ncbi:MAG: UbiA family prenyltransferase [Ardenticatenales bacterium]|nr:UbiA family prenyltransferase [Ardenticatenales bacterium]
MKAIDAQASGPLAQVKVFLDMIKFEHTIFALPFAYIGMVLAVRGWPSWADFFWITVAMASARTLAMAVNRVADAAIDARNPRTAGRPIPSGKMKASTVWALAFLSLAIFILAALNLNPYVWPLAPLALFALTFYSYTKRFTWLCHWWLGATDGAAAAGGWAAIRGNLDPIAWLLWGAVTTWIAGFDLIYACQDVAFDRAEGLHSFPSRFGIAAALNTARVMHLLTALLLAAVGVVAALGWPYWLGWLIAITLLVYENSLVKPDDLSKVDLAFFTVNGYIAVIVFIGTLLGVYFG